MCAVTINQNERLDIVNDDVRLIQKKDGLTFGTDALLLASFIDEKETAHGMELGGGSGIISFLLLARQKARHITVAEIQPAFADLCRRNAALNDFDDRVTVIESDVRLLPSDDDGSYTFVFTNPPYMKPTGKMNRTHEKTLARHEICGDINDFCAAAAKKLKYGGHFYCVFRPDRLADLFVAMRQNGIEPKVMTTVYASAMRPPSVVLVKGKRGGNAALTVTKPLFLYENTTHTAWSSDYLEILEKGRLPLHFFHDVKPKGIS